MKTESYYELIIEDGVPCPPFIFSNKEKAETAVRNGLKRLAKQYNKKTPEFWKDEYPNITYHQISRLFREYAEKFGPIDEIYTQLVKKLGDMEVQLGDILNYEYMELRALKVKNVKEIKL